MAAPASEGEQKSHRFPKESSNGAHARKREGGWKGILRNKVFFVFFGRSQDTKGRQLCYCLAVFVVISIG